MDVILLLILLIILIIYILYTNFVKQYSGNIPKYNQPQHQFQHKNSYTLKLELQKKFIENQLKESLKTKTFCTISRDVVDKVLADLETFERESEFLEKGITLANLSKKFNTNTAYLSEIINIYKGKNFATYLNDLRIECAINRLSDDRKFRSYKLSVIADELGYNNEQAFTLAFKKRTGTPLSVYLKEMERLKETP
ncbi:MULTISPECIES: AraC family transcriptional regulator [unclassified Chryseobacterium]|uniref:helix-turn-helix domain-containing protein n=1 Tax=unclassified Chryseobacterium TaxID=2593645 RepID=UPI00226A7174|nr:MULTISPECIES: AraC family transcriptional regulator [unclassified Chryseobacterium]